ncbi:hypothetical protein L211DRAFT_460077 [Terfezia boudieri ATCC MYA-4762]|uniref:Uncharacterized protein n=1 Tax=Terfezia boudieri ATCC MYA-4762 TaxID=1051890 RepID=A0A3N4LHY8_9PEZI|nr:hypothetical protein L211DRAFT_460077 [Terfezia boudieri ATCC MYA-4762]
MCSAFETCHPLWLGAAVLNDTPVGKSFNGLHEKTISCPNYPNIADIIAATYPGTSRGLIASTSPTASIRQESSRHQMNSSFRSRLANHAAYSTTSSDPSLDARTAIRARAPEGTNFDTQVAMFADDDADADADSEAESDTSQCFDSGSEGIEDDDDGGQEHRFGDGGEFGYSGHGERGYDVDGDNDTTMANIEPPPSPAFAQASAYAAITNPSKKPRHHNLPRKQHGLPGTQRSMISPASPIDIDMNGPADEDFDDCYSDSSADEDTDEYAYSTWFGGIYHPMWLGHATASGKKRRDNGLEEDAAEGRECKAVEVGAVAELGKRHIRLPSLSRRKRAWKASQGTRSSVGDSEWSLSVQTPVLGTNAGALSSPQMSPVPLMTTKPMHTAPRNTQLRHRHSPARALERRLENLRVEDLGRGTTTTVVAANDLRPRMSSDQHEKKRTRYQTPTPFEVASMEATGRNVITTPVIWDVVLEEPMGFRPSGVDGQWDSQVFEMTGVEVNMSSPAGGMIQLDVSERVKDFSRVMEGVEDLL